MVMLKECRTEGCQKKLHWKEQEKGEGHVKDGETRLGEGGFKYKGNIKTGRQWPEAVQNGERFCWKPDLRRSSRRKRRMRKRKRQRRN
jgi:hypothetical protein